MRLFRSSRFLAYLDMAVNDPDEQPVAPADGTQRVPAGGLRSMFRFDIPTSEQAERNNVASWVAASAGFITDLIGRGVKVQSCCWVAQQAARITPGDRRKPVASWPDVVGRSTSFVQLCAISIAALSRPSVARDRLAPTPRETPHGWS